MSIETKKFTLAIPSNHGDSVSADIKMELSFMGKAVSHQKNSWDALKLTWNQNADFDTHPHHPVIYSHFPRRNSEDFHIISHNLNHWAHEIDSKIIHDAQGKSGISKDAPAKNQQVSDELNDTNEISRGFRTDSNNGEHDGRHLNSPTYNHMEFLTDLSEIVKEIKTFFCNPSITYEFDPNEDFISLTIQVINIDSTIKENELIVMEKILHAKLQDLVINKEIFNNIIIDVL